MCVHYFHGEVYSDVRDKVLFGDVGKVTEKEERSNQEEKHSAETEATAKPFFESWDLLAKVAFIVSFVWVLVVPHGMVDFGQLEPLHNVETGLREAPVQYDFKFH